MQVDSANLFGFHLQFADSAYNFWISFTVADSTTAKIYVTHIICLWIPQTVPSSANFVANFTNFVADSKKLPIFGAILSIQCSSYLSVEFKTAMKQSEIQNCNNSAFGLLRNPLRIHKSYSLAS